MDASVDRFVGTLCLALADQLLDQMTDQYVVISLSISAYLERTQWQSNHSYKPEYK